MSTSEALEETFFLSKDGRSVCMLMSEKQSSTCLLYTSDAADEL